MSDFFAGLKEFLGEPIRILEWTLPFSLQKLILEFALPVLGIMLVYFLVFRILKGILKKIGVPEETRRNIQRWVRLVLRLAVFLVIGLLVGNLLGIRGASFLGNLIKFLNEPLFTTGNTTISIVTIILLIPVFYISSLAGQSIQRLLASNIFPQVQSLDEAKQFSIGKLARYATMGLVFFFLLSIIGIDFSAIGALLAVLGIGVGFGLQDLVANFFAGIVIIFARQIKERDRITVDGHEGTVTVIRLLSTSITTLENENLIVPNSHITNSVVYNASYADREIILVNVIEVHYDSDLDRAIEIISEVGEQNPYRKKNMIIRVIVREFRSSGIAMELRLWIRDVTDKLDALSWNNLELWRAFRAQGITIPYPQVDVHMKPETLEKAGKKSEDLPE